MIEKEGLYFIDLYKIPQNGSHYSWTQTDGLLQKSLTPLIGQNPFSIAIEIRIIHELYEISGKIEVSFDLLCSRCAYDFKKPVLRSFKEYIVIEKNHYENEDKGAPRHKILTEKNEDQSFCHYLKTSLLNVSDFLYEQVAISEPTHPMGKEDCDDTCENYQKALKQGWLQKQSHQPHQAFETLKNFKPKK